MNMLCSQVLQEIYANTCRYMCALMRVLTHPHAWFPLSALTPHVLNEYHNTDTSAHTQHTHDKFDIQ